MLDSLLAGLRSIGVGHEFCYQLDPTLIWLHVVADGLIALAYFSIPAILLYFVRRRRDVPFPGVFLLFGSFIVACGLTHLLGVVTMWQPFHYLSGFTKVATAAISLVTAAVMVRITPLALRLPSPDALARLNAELEDRVRDRTSELTRLNSTLQEEIRLRSQAEAEARRLATELGHRVNTLRTLVETMPVGVAVRIDSPPAPLTVNRTYRQLFHQPENPPADAPGLEYLDRAVASAAPIEDVETAFQLPGGRSRTVIASAKPLTHEDGSVRGAIGAFLDITARKEAEAERALVDSRIRETQKLESLGVLAGGIAHDFNNLLTGVLGNASLARLDLPAGSSAETHLQAIETAAHRAADLCRQMLAYSGKGRFSINAVDLSALVTSSTDLLGISIGKRATLHLDLRWGLPAVQADASQLQQVLVNLVTNAAEAIGDRSGRVTIATGTQVVDEAYLRGARVGDTNPPGNYVFFDVQDDGSGMDAETLGRIFDPFFTTKFTGRGLGLSAVHGIVRGHRGALRVYSEVGRGSTFKVLLPASQARLPTAPKPAGEVPIDPVGGSVLVIDDEEIVRVAASRMLRRFGLEPVAVPSGREGIELVRVDPGRFRAVLLDLTMPDLDGEETFRRLRALRANLPVLLMSGFNEQDAIARFTGKGLAGFLQKPFHATALRSRLAVVLATPLPPASAHEGSSGDQLPAAQPPQ